MNVLVLNSGSSSQKSCLYKIGDVVPDEPPLCVWEGKIEFSGETAESSIKTSGGISRTETIAAPSRGEAIERMLGTLWSGDTQAIPGPQAIDVVGHRVVHGGPDYFEPTAITAEVKSALAKVAVFAPLHNRAEIEGMEIVEKLLGPVPQVAVFDTGFHRSMPLSAATYPGPYEWFEQGIRRYGFHGINHQYCSQRAAQILGKNLARLVTCHLGNGCSLAAIRDGKSVDTTMGFTPLEGLMMGTRSGTVDPGILTYLVREKHFSGEQLDEMLNQKSGLLGVSGISSDMREILAAISKSNERAKLALDIYVHRLQSGIGAMIGVLGGIDALVFTGGVGENSQEIRASVCENFAFLGMTLDPQKNSKPEGDGSVAARDSLVDVLIIRAQEDWMIARACRRLQREQA